jgi:ketosteroid isomerase-like protein
MKRVSALVALAIALSSLAFGQTPDAKQNKPAAMAAKPGGVEQTLMQMEHDVTTAIIKRDVAAVGAAFADDFIFTGPDGMTQTKAQFLADIKSGDLALESSEISDMKVRVYGTAAVATYSTTDKGKFKGQDIGGRYRWTDTFVRHGEKWQVVAGQGTPLTAK